MKRLRAADEGTLRKIFGEDISPGAGDRATGTLDIADEIRQRRMGWYAHIARAKPAMCDDSTLYAD